MIHSRLAIVVSSDATSLEVASTAIADAWAAERQGTITVTAPPASIWPFTHPLAIERPPAPAIIRLTAIHEAFINRQTASTRLVTTQPAYLMQVWLDAIADRDVLLLATADKATLAEHAPEVLAKRGPFAEAAIHNVDENGIEYHSTGCCEATGSARQIEDAAEATGATALLVRAFRVADPAERLALCVRTLQEERTPPALVATASAFMEANDLLAAERNLDEALAHAPEWAAAHFERGKLWLRVDDMERASESFRATTERLPGFVSAWANLGATLGELGRPQQALAAFEHALRGDPTSHQALNNIGVVNRELGNLAESESAFRRVVQLAPDLAYGHYNLGHTLFLQGRYQTALSAYVEGQKRDGDRNPVQASRLALCRLAAGDASGALRELQRAMSGLPREYRQQLLADTSAIAWALLTHRPELAGWKQVNDWLTGELAKVRGAT